MEDISKLWEEDSKPKIDNIKDDTLKDVSFWAQEQIRLEEEIGVAEEKFCCICRLHSKTDSGFY